MNFDLASLDGEQQAESWRLLTERVPQFVDDPPQSLAVADLLTPPTHTVLATVFVQSQRSKAVFVTADQLLSIATEEMILGRARMEIELNEVEAIYVFLALVGQEILKVGQAENLRTRIANGHLRYGNRRSQCNLIDYCGSRGWPWPKCIEDREITLLAFPWRRSSKIERCFVETGLQELLRPEMK
jgi:hypothetical protein